MAAVFSEPCTKITVSPGLLPGGSTNRPASDIPPDANVASWTRRALVQLGIFRSC
jgi:hypothetical protein